MGFANHRRLRGSLSALLTLMLLTPCAPAAETVTYEHGGERRTVRGEILVEAADGGLLLEAADSSICAIQPDAILDRASDEQPCEPLSREELLEALTRELPSGFKRHDTAHFMIVYNTTDAYAQWCGALYERLYQGFNNYWSQRDLELHDPEMPLVALVFADQASYTRYASEELGEAASSTVGFYSLLTNRMAMYDLTGADGQRRSDGPGSNMAQINRILSQPGAAETVSTIVHEATHQLAYNCGMQVRFADNPLWISEGLAMYFETPDLTSNRGWRGIGRVSPPRLTRYRQYMLQQPQDSLRSLLEDDRRFRNPELAGDAYAEAWTLTHMLARRYGDELGAYLEALGDKRIMIYDSPEERVRLFESTFGKTVEQMEDELRRYAMQLD